MYDIEKILTESQALLTGHFLFTSGRHGGEYMQCAKVLQYPWYAEQIAETVSGKFEKGGVDIVLAPAVGGIIIGHEAARRLRAKSIFAERVNGKMTLRRGFEIPAGARVLVAEDVVTTGLSTRDVIAIVTEQNAVLAGVCCLVDRTGGAMDFGVPFAAAYSKNMPSYMPEECPLCKAGVPIVTPGSRGVSQS